MGSGIQTFAKASLSIISDIARQFKNLQCVPCSNAVAKAFKKEGISGEIIECRTLSESGKEVAANIVSPANERKGIKDAISQSGMHRGVLVNGKVYDNIHTEGVDYNEWIQDFKSLAPKFKVTTIEKF